MVFSRSDAPVASPTGAAPHTESVPVPVKIIVAGGFAVGKTTFVGSLSEIDPLTTEANMTAASEDIDEVGSATSKKGTTVAMDFGRISLATI